MLHYYVFQKSAPVIDREGDILIGTLLQDVKARLARLERQVSELERQIQLHQPISFNSEQVKELLEFRQQPEPNTRFVSVKTTSVQTEKCTSPELEQVPASAASIDDTVSRLITDVQSYLEPTQCHYSAGRSNSLTSRQRSDSKRSSGIGLSLDFERLRNLREEPIAMKVFEKVENIDEEPTDSQQMNPSAQMKLDKEQKILWAMEDLLFALKEAQ